MNYIKKRFYIVIILQIILGLILIPFNLILSNYLTEIFSELSNIQLGIFIKTIFFLLLFTIIFNIVEMVLSYFIDKLITKKTYICKEYIYGRTLEKTLSELYYLKKGEFIENINDDLQMIIDTISKNIPSVIVNVVVFVTFCTILACENTLIMFIVILCSLIQVLPGLFVKKSTEYNYEDMRKVEAEMTEMLIEGYRGFSVIRIFGQENWFLDKIKKLHKKYEKVSIKSSGTTSLTTSMEAFTEYITKYGSIISAGVMYAYNLIDIDTVAYVIVLSNSTTEAAKKVLFEFPNYIKYVTAKKRLFEKKKTTKHLSADYTYNNIISLNNVHSKLGENLRGVNLTIDLNDYTIIKGENGVGKTSIIRIILQIEDEYKGDVVIPEYFENYENVGILMQKEFDIDLSFDEYLECFRFDYDKFSENMNKFKIKSELLKKPVKELSGGEKQKILLSYILAKNVRVLILDEPSNSLDKESALILRDILEKKECGKIIVTHESYFDKSADKIVTIKKGEYCE